MSAGAPPGELERLSRLCGALLIVYPDHRFAAEYGRLQAQLHRARAAVHAMDLLIATAAILDDASLVTRNVKQFARVPRLRVQPY